MIEVHRRQLLLLGAATLASRFLTACRGPASVSSASPLRRAGANGGWATGGTASMTAKASYPNPFATTAMTPKCAMSCELMVGPCYDAQSVEQQDISYGYSGLPTRVQIRLLDESCKPISGAVVEVWHASPVGKYSGNDNAHENVPFCTENDPDFASHLYFRGKQTSDANGIVTFDTCYPGWYSGRAIHVHAAISINGQSYLATQLCFDDTLNDEIISSQPLYDARGSLDTKNGRDGVFPPNDFADYQFQTAKMTDGALLAYKTIILRSAVDEKVCRPSGAGRPGRRDP